MTSQPVLSSDPALPPAAASPAPVLPRLGTGFAVILAVCALLLSGMLWQKLQGIQEELARRSTDSGTQAAEARALARQAQTLSQELSGRLALQETRISEVSLQRSQLEELIQSMSRSRDENLVVDIDSALRLAQQQAQLTGSAEPLLAALRTAEQRLSRTAQPRLNLLQRAIARDIDRVKAASLTDVPLLIVKLDELVHLSDDVPVANAMRTAPAPNSPATPHAQAAPVAALSRQALSDWSARIWQSIGQEAQQLLRVSRIDQPEAVLQSPEQSFFLRENFKLTLLNARLSLLSRQTDAARVDLLRAQTWLGKYFDPHARTTQSAKQLLSQVQSQLKSNELPRLDETLTALATAAAGR